jgi:exodeoxyribonuclease VII small subunit
VTERKKTPAKKLSFGEAVGEVEQILERLEQEEVDIDDLGREVQRAVELIKVCREKLARTDREVRELVADLQKSNDEQMAAEPAGEADSNEAPF